MSLIIYFVKRFIMKICHRRQGRLKRTWIGTIKNDILEKLKLSIDNKEGLYPCQPNDLQKKKKIE